MGKFDFNPVTHKNKLQPLLKELMLSDSLTVKKYHSIVRKHPQTKNRVFSKSQVIAALRQFYPSTASAIIKKIQAKPIRTLSGVVPVTLLTKSYPCPGRCLYCPNDPQMPKSYLSAEPGAQRAAQNHFDPYHQVTTRLQTYYANGHSTDKVELIVLGGTWSAYPKGYKIWFIKRCFDALNNFFPDLTLTKPQFSGTAGWLELKKAQLKNRTSTIRCVGLSLETRPDFITSSQLIDFRRLGCTKVQIGIQSLNNQVLKANRRGHTVKATKTAIKLLRSFGFKIQAHWMANLYGSDAKKDIADFKKLFSQKAYRPDELKIYPTSLIASAPLMAYYQQGLWQPYTYQQLLTVLSACLLQIPPYCRVTRVIRDFSSQDIISGNKSTNFRQIVENELKKKHKTLSEIRSREIRNQPVNPRLLKLKVLSYQTSIGTEKFLQFVDSQNRLAAFLRLSLPSGPAPVKELSYSALIRELHVYGPALAIGIHQSDIPQHLGLGKSLIKQAALIAQKHHYQKLAVISAVGTTPYYQKLNFTTGNLYQFLSL